MATGVSEIQQFYAGATVFITGGTGFLGTLLVEKLLRTCHELKKLYVLMRPKKGLCSKDRHRDYFQKPLFDVLKQKSPQALNKLFIIEGDGVLPNLGINDEDRAIIINEVNCIFCIAATTRFNESFRKAIHINVRGPRDLLAMAKGAKHLKALIYVSSAYSFCPRELIEEVVYDTTVKGENLIATVDGFSEDQLSVLAPIMRGNWPNTYSFTKAVAEDLIKRHGAGLPVAIYRPSMVVATAKEPVPGWIDNLYTTTGYFAGTALGAIHAWCFQEKCRVDIVPGDYVINCMLAIAWERAKQKSIHNIGSKSACEAPVYNYVPTQQNSITFGNLNRLGRKHTSNIPSVKKSWHSFCFINSSSTLYLFLNYLFHFLPALALHLINTLAGNKSRVMKEYHTFNNMVHAYRHFCTNQWTFNSDNVQALWQRLSSADKTLFEFDMNVLDWDSFINTYMTGIRVYLLRDPLDTLPQARIRDRKLQIIHYAVVIAFAGVALAICLVLASFLLN